MTTRAPDRRRLLAGGGAAAALAGLATVTGCAPTTSGSGPGASLTSAAPATTSGPSSSPSATASASPSASSTTAVTAVHAPRLADRLESYLDGRSGDLGLQLVDLRRGQSFSHDAEEGYCYSTIKVLVLTTLLAQRQADDKQLSARHRGLAERMITRSDNAATEALLAEVGRDEVRRVGDLVGMSRTEMDEGWWGLWRTVPRDLNRMVDAVLSSDVVLDGSRRAVARFLMADVVPEQRWGVFAPESGTVHVAGKNGWGPLPDGYRLNSVGWVTADDREYQLAIMSTSPAGFRYGRRTISEVAQICHEAVGSGLS